MALSAQQKAAKLESDLQFILEDLNVPIEMQAKAFDLDYTSVRLFGEIGDDRPSARSNIALVFDIDPQQDGLDARDNLPIASNFRIRKSNCLQ